MASKKFAKPKNEVQLSLGAKNERHSDFLDFDLFTEKTMGTAENLQRRSSNIVLNPGDRIKWLHHGAY